MTVTEGLKHNGGEALGSERRPTVTNGTEEAEETSCLARRSFFGLRR